MPPSHFTIVRASSSLRDLMSAFSCSAKFLVGEDGLREAGHDDANDPRHGLLIARVEVVVHAVGHYHCRRRRLLESARLR